MEIINISKKNEVYIQIDSEASTAQEICDHFTFMVPGYTFMPAYRNRIWDGKIRLFNVHSRLLYGGLFGNVTVGMVVEQFVADFPEFLMAVAEENWIRGYHQGLADVEEGEKILKEQNENQENVDDNNE